MARQDMRNDPYAKYRSSRTTHLLGVTMELTYLIGTAPSDVLTDDPSLDVSDTTTLSYDLEMDKDGTIIGSEWHNLFHPDFLWAVAKDYLPKTIQDHVIGTGLTDYTGKNPLPAGILLHGHEAEKNQEVLYSVLAAMLRLSQL